MTDFEYIITVEGIYAVIENENWRVESKIPSQSAEQAEQIVKKFFMEGIYG